MDRLVLSLFAGGSNTVVLGPGIKVAEAPIQHNLTKADSFPFKDYHIAPLAEFKLKGKILAREDYFLGRESDLSPVDLPLVGKKCPMERCWKISICLNQDDGSIGELRAFLFHEMRSKLKVPLCI